MRRQRTIVAIVAAAVVGAVFAWLVVVPAVRGFLDDHSDVPYMDVSGSGLSAAVSSASPTPTPTPTPSPAVTVVPEEPLATEKPPIVKDYITFGEARQDEMAAYSERHYGEWSVVLEPEVVVLHYTCSSSYPGVHSLFESDTPNLDELPGVVAHFVVDKDGTIYQQIPLDKRGRHTVGLNHVAIGIEVVQEAGSGDADACGEIMSRKKQVNALVDLVRWLRHRYDIALKNVVGHGTANASPYFKDLQGWSNSHVDWSSAQIKKFRELLREDGR